MLLGKRSPFKYRADKGAPPWKSYFAVIGCSSVKTVANKQKCCFSQQALATSFLEMSTPMTLNNLEPPESVGFSELFRDFVLRCTFQEWIAPKWLGIDQDNLHTKFMPLNV